MCVCVCACMRAKHIYIDVKNVIVNVCATTLYTSTDLHKTSLSVEPLVLKTRVPLLTTYTYNKLGKDAFIVAKILYGLLDKRKKVSYIISNPRL